MRRQLAIFLISFFWFNLQLSSFTLEFNTSYEYFRGLPEGSWNGNSGAFAGVNGIVPLYEGLDIQVGGSYGAYNWDGRGNVVFNNPKATEQIGFVTAGASYGYCNWKGGVVYDRFFSKHYSVYDLKVSVDQLRFKGGYSFCREEVGVWGTLDLNGAHKKALGLPVRFKAIGQMNLFWSHLFENSAETTLWVGMPYRHSLMFPHSKAGDFIGGFSFRVPLTERFYLDGNGSYMSARHSHGVKESRDYGSSICVGLTYLFSGNGTCPKRAYLPLANPSNFFVDTNRNQ